MDLLLYLELKGRKRLAVPSNLPLSPSSSFISSSLAFSHRHNTFSLSLLLSLSFNYSVLFYLKHSLPPTLLKSIKSLWESTSKLFIALPPLSLPCLVSHSLFLLHTYFFAGFFLDWLLSHFVKIAAFHSHSHSRQSVLMKHINNKLKRLCQ